MSAVPLLDRNSGYHARSPRGTASGALALCAAPTLLLRAELDAQTDALRLLAIKPDLKIGVTVGAGHFHQLEVPDQVNAMIDRFLELAEL